MVRQHDDRTRSSPGPTSTGRPHHPHHEHDFPSHEVTPRRARGSVGGRPGDRLQSIPDSSQDHPPQVTQERTPRPRRRMMLTERRVQVSSHSPRVCEALTRSLVTWEEHSLRPDGGPDQTTAPVPEWWVEMVQAELTALGQTRLPLVWRDVVVSGRDIVLAARRLRWESIAIQWRDDLTPEEARSLWLVDVMRTPDTPGHFAQDPLRRTLSDLAGSDGHSSPIPFIPLPDDIVITTTPTPESERQADRPTVRAMVHRRRRTSSGAS